MAQAIQDQETAARDAARRSQWNDTAQPPQTLNSWQCCKGPSWLILVPTT